MTQREQEEAWLRFAAAALGGIYADPSWPAGESPTSTAATAADEMLEEMRNRFDLTFSKE